MPASYYLLSRRRRWRGAVGGIALLLAAGAFVLMRGNNPDADHETITEGGETSVVGGPPGQLLGPLDAERSRWLAGNKNACEGDPWNAFDGKCKVKMVHKHPAARTPGNGARGLRLAVGRSSTPPAAAVTDADSGAANAPTKAPAKFGKADHPRVASLKGHKSEHTGDGTHEFARRRAWPDDPWSARAYAWPGTRPRWGWGW